MDIRQIKNEADYDWALREVETYFDNEPDEGSQAAERFNVLCTLIEAYEAAHWPIEAPEPIAAIRHVMARDHYRQADLAKLLGSRSRASEIINRKRPLTLEQARLLHEHWKIPAEVLLRPVLME